tara:strand:+ start:172 stop:558 length:387 start_codon:yes stop_codon:yes gene_type:complete
MDSEEARNLVYRTGMAESGYRHLEQVKGPALGFWQVEPATIKDTVYNYAKFRQPLMDKLIKRGLLLDDLDNSVLSSLYLQIAFCRLKYRRDKHPIPHTLKDQADYWKRVYNSEGGKGTPEHFIKANIA